MTDLTEKHEVRVRGHGHEFVFSADSEDGRLHIRQESDGRSKKVCAISIADPEELKAFFQGLRRMLEALGHRPDASPVSDGTRGVGTRQED